MTDGAFQQTDLISAAENAALTLARSLGLGDEVRIGDDWSIDDGDVTLCSELSGDAEGQFVLGVNDVVAERLLSDAAVLEAAFRSAMAGVAEALPARLDTGPISAIAVRRPTVIVEILDAGVLTSLAGLTLPVSAPPVSTQDFEPASFDDAFEGAGLNPLATLTVLNDVELVVTAELGRTTMAVRDLLGLSPGMVVEIDRAAGSPIDLLVNGRRIAAGEVVVIDEEFGIRITEIAPIGDRRR
ncbi:MAG: fliN [Ilumatobacteraceae bacterium]|nr:fliN [Ilumatobacteraceae bacterium]